MSNEHERSMALEAEYAGEVEHADSRDRIEADVREFLTHGGTVAGNVSMYRAVLDWLDRQAEITKLEVEPALMNAEHMTVERERATDGKRGDSDAVSRHDSRQLIEADAGELVADYARNGSVCDALYNGILALLDRQAAITSNEMKHNNPYVGLVRGKQWERTEFSDYYCGRCGWKVTDHDSYCPECGGALHGAPNKPDGKTAEMSGADTAKGDIHDFDDTREKLEAEVMSTVSNLVNYCGAHPALFEKAKSWLDRQAEITERETKPRDGMDTDWKTEAACEDTPDSREKLESEIHNILHCISITAKSKLEDGTFEFGFVDGYEPLLHELLDRQAAITEHVVTSKNYANWERWCKELGIECTAKRAGEQFKQMDGRIRELESKLRECDEQRLEFRDQRDHLQAEHDKLMLKLVRRPECEACARLMMLIEERDGLQSRYDELTVERDEWKAKAEYQQEILDCDCRDIRDFQNEIEGLTEERDALRAKLRICKEYGIEVVDAVAGGYEVYDERRKRIDELQAERDKLVSNAEVGFERIKELEAERDSLVADNDHLQERMLGLEDDIISLETERDEAVRAYDAHIEAHDIWHEPEDITYTRNRFAIYEQATKERIARLESERDELQAELDAYGETHMLLPVDTDGVPIHVGDTIEYPNGKRDVVRFITVNDNMPTFNESGWVASKCRHVKPKRTIESVLRDVWKEALDYAKSDMWRSPNEVFAERADEIRGMLGVCDG